MRTRIGLALRSVLRKAHQSWPTFTPRPNDSTSIPLRDSAKTDVYRANTRLTWDGTLEHWSIGTNWRMLRSMFGSYVRINSAKLV